MNSLIIRINNDLFLVITGNVIEPKTGYIYHKIAIFAAAFHTYNKIAWSKIVDKLNKDEGRIANQFNEFCYSSLS